MRLLIVKYANKTKQQIFFGNQIAKHQRLIKFISPPLYVSSCPSACRGNRRHALGLR
jgi:hypothetical protein